MRCCTRPNSNGSSCSRRWKTWRPTAHESRCDVGAESIVDRRLVLGFPAEGTLIKRVTLFLLTNLAILLVLSFTARLLGLDRFLMSNGLNLGGLLMFAALFGFGGSLISLAISKWSAKMAVGARVIEAPSNPTER